MRKLGNHLSVYSYSTVNAVSGHIFNFSWFHNTEKKCVKSEVMCAHSTRKYSKITLMTYGDCLLQSWAQNAQGYDKVTK